jgi:hypothetical protein
MKLDLAVQLKAVGLPYAMEVEFHPSRKWRLDFVVAGAIAVEVMGAVFKQGRHTRGKGYEEDCEKQNEAEIRGFTYLRVTPTHVLNGKALEWIQRAVKARE